MDITALYPRSVEAWAARLGTVTTDQWDGPTPCAEWTVRELVNHVVGEELWTTPLMQGKTIEQVGDRFDGDLLGDDPLAAASAAAEEAKVAVTAGDSTGRKVHLSYGDEDAGEYLYQLVADHLIHSWDLAAATDGDTQLDADLVKAVSAWFAGREELYRAAGAIGPRTSAGSDPQSALLAAFGRSPDWSPKQG